MRNFISSVLVVASMFVVCCSAHSEATNNVLAFYVISEKNIEGGRFIDTQDMPRLGYIASKPDLMVTNLQAAARF